MSDMSDEEAALWREETGTPDFTGDCAACAEGIDPLTLAHSFLAPECVIKGPKSETFALDTVLRAVEFWFDAGVATTGAWDPNDAAAGRDDVHVLKSLVLEHMRTLPEQKAFRAVGRLSRAYASGAPPALPRHVVVRNGKVFVRFRWTPDRASGKRQGWAKRVAAVDRSQRGGYALDGLMLYPGEQELPVGAVLVNASPTGSARFPGKVYSLAWVDPTAEGGLRWVLRDQKEAGPTFLDTVEAQLARQIRRQVAACDTPRREADEAGWTKEP